MKKIIIWILALALLMLIGAVIFRFTAFTQIVSSAQQEQIGKISDSNKIKDTIRVAGDNYFGYWFLTSKEFRIRLGQKGYALTWNNDGGNYEERENKFNNNEYDIMVLPVNSYIQHGAPSYPGLIVAAISDSKGADNIVGYKSKFGDQPKVNDLNNSSWKIGVTPDSPSSFLLNTAIVYFDLNKIKGKSFVSTNGSDDALKKLLNKELDAAVLWEPNVSQALQNADIVKIYGSDKISGMIIDVFVANNNILLSKPGMIEEFLKTYFETLEYYSANRDEMIQEMSKTTSFKTNDDVQKALDSISWFNLRDNCDDWFGKGEKIIRTITQVRDVMQEIGELKDDPLQGNPYRIISTKILASIDNNSISSGIVGVSSTAKYTFSQLTDTDWSKLKVFGMLKVLPINFDSSTSKLTSDGAKVVDQSATLAVYNFAQYRVLVKGHTAGTGDESANVQLSSQRAETVRNYLIGTYGIDGNRVKSMGMGSSEPLSRDTNESERSYRSRLARVEIILLEDKK